MSLPYVLPQRLKVDPYGPNPLVSDLSASQLSRFQLASERGPAPTLFATGDLPPFTASGVDPNVLAGLPYHWRHAAASHPDAAVVLSWLEECAQDREVSGHGGDRGHRGLMDYRMRMESWVAGIDVPDVAWEDAGYPEAWSARDHARAEQDELAAQEVAAQAQHDSRMADLRRQREAARHKSFLGGSR